MSTPTIVDPSQYLLPCPRWCDGHLTDQSFWGDLGDEVVVEHVARCGVDQPLLDVPGSPGPAVAVWLEQHAELVDGEVRSEPVVVQVREWEAASPEECEALAAALLEAAGRWRQLQADRQQP